MCLCFTSVINYITVYREKISNCQMHLTFNNAQFNKKKKNLIIYNRLYTIELQNSWHFIEITSSSTHCKSKCVTLSEVLLTRLLPFWVVSFNTIERINFQFNTIRRVK